MLLNIIMKIFDCFIFNDENLILELRLSELYEKVDFFIIVEFGENHQGGFKGKKINQNILKKYKKKIRYYYVRKFQKGLTSWQKENYQRNFLVKGLFDAKDEDIIIISDLDEIPNLKKIKFSKIRNEIIAFKQINTMYKFNLARDFNWIGSKLCKYKKLKSPQWLRSLKFHKKYSYLRIDKFFSNTYTYNFRIIKNGGWHFGWIRSINGILKKLEAFAHVEFNNKKYKNTKYIKYCYNKNINFLYSKEKLKKINLNLLPNYIKKNKSKFNKYLN